MKRSRIYPVSKLGRVFLGPDTFVTPEAFGEARELLEEARDRRTERTKEPEPRAASKATDIWYTPEMIAVRMKLHPSTIRGYCRTGQRVASGVDPAFVGPYLIAAQCGTQWRVSETEFLKFIGRIEGREVPYERRRK
jgi:hypothetical protein